MEKIRTLDLFWFVKWNVSHPGKNALKMLIWEIKLNVSIDVLKY